MREILIPVLALLSTNIIQVTVQAPKCWVQAHVTGNLILVPAIAATNIIVGTVRTQKHRVQAPVMGILIPVLVFPHSNFAPLVAHRLRRFAWIVAAPSIPNA